MLQGQQVIGPLPEAMRTYRLMKLGVPFDRIDDQPAWLLDELLAIDEIYAEVNRHGG